MATRTIGHIEFPADDGERAANGGSVITPPSDIPGQGRYAAVRDPEWNEVGLYQDSRS